MEPAPAHLLGRDVPSGVVPGHGQWWGNKLQTIISLLVVAGEEEEGESEGEEPDVPGVVVALARHDTSIAQLGKDNMATGRAGDRRGTSIPKAMRFSTMTKTNSQKYSLLVGTGLRRGVLTMPMASMCSRVFLDK